MGKLKGAVIGVGYLGNFHAQKVAASPDAELVGVFDAFPAQAQKIATQLNVKAFEKLEDVVSAGVDFVTIAAATQAHYELASYFLKNKIAVLVEKPIAATAELGEKLCQLAKENKTLFTVGHIERFNPAYKYLCDHAAEIKYLEINRLAPFRVRGSDVSVLHDLMIHDLDLVQFIFNQKIVESTSFGHQFIRPTIDDTSVFLKLEKGVQVHIQNSRLHPVIQRNYRAVLSHSTIFVNTATLEGEILTYDPENENLHKIEKITFPKVDALGLEIQHFIQAVRGDHAVKISPEEATMALRNVEKLVQDISQHVH